jgi:hypothetical protein
MSLLTELEPFLFVVLQICRADGAAGAGVHPLPPCPSTKFPIHFVNWPWADESRPKLDEKFCGYVLCFHNCKKEVFPRRHRKANRNRPYFTPARLFPTQLWLSPSAYASRMKRMTVVH